MAVSNAATGAGTGAALLNSVGGLFVLLAFLFGGRPRGLGGFGFGITLKYLSHPCLRRLCIEFIAWIDHSIS